jgi:hypothetical protein
MPRATTAGSTILGKNSFFLCWAGSVFKSGFEAFLPSNPTRSPRLPTAK